jgi:hypothetical protein
MITIAPLVNGCDHYYQYFLVLSPVDYSYVFGPFELISAFLVMYYRGVKQR